MRIKLFNKKTLYEFYRLELKSKHILFNNNTMQASLISKEKTLGPSCIDTYFTVCENINSDAKKEIKEYLIRKLEREFIDHLNENVGIECLIKKEEVPEGIYKRIKNESKNKISLVEI